MADELRIGLSELLRKAMIEQDAGFLREGVRVLSQALMEMEVEQHVERDATSAARSQGTTNGYRQRNWDTRVGTVELKVPRVRDSGYFPRSWSPVGEPRGRSLRWSRRPTSTASPRARWTSW